MTQIRIALALLFAISSQAHCQEREAPTPTEFWVTGDDGLTQRFAQAVTASLSKSKTLSAPTSNNSDGLVLTIPRNLYWQDVKGKTNFQYVVIFTDKSSKYLGISIGACWEKGMNGCADTVVEEAERTWANRQSGGA